MVDGIVNLWGDGEGWGVLVSPGVPGEVGAHFSNIAVGDETGYRTLAEGDLVRFSYEHYPEGQDGYFWRAERIVPRHGEFAQLTDQEIVGVGAGWRVWIRVAVRSDRRYPRSLCRGRQAWLECRGRPQG